MAEINTERQDAVVSSESETVLDELTIRDIDEALVRHFQNTYASEIMQGGRGVPVRFAAGERWALDRDNLIKDSDGRLNLPIVIVNREQETFQDVANLPGDTRELTLARRVQVQGSQDIAEMHQGQAQPNKAVNLGDFKFAQTIDSTHVRPGQHVVMDFLVSSFPSFVELQYSFKFWTNTVNEANRMTELFYHSFHWRNLIAIVGTKKQTYQAKFDGQLSRGETNLKDFSDNRRIIEVEGTITVFGWLVTRPRIVRKKYDPKIRKGFSRIRWETETG
tara:strand:- start:4036 stop:4866 length:831 start_codon:yes stop_codon:yes gene_type:complete